MDIKGYIKTAYDYTYWANQRYFAVAEGLTHAAAASECRDTAGAMCMRRWCT